jgi:hypothetical protein
MPDHLTDQATPERRAEIIKGLRELADFLEGRPDAPLHHRYGVSGVDVYASWFEGRVDTVTFTHPRSIVKAMGKADKSFYGNVLELTRTFSGGIRYQVNLARDVVCTPSSYVTVPKTERVCLDEQRAAELQAQLDELHEDRVVGHEQVVAAYDCPPSLLAVAS